jgi:glucan phosphoethanolaminetransferase (alkaline phosphatase superfamily)
MGNYEGVVLPENQRVSEKKSIGLIIVQILTTLCESVPSRRPELRSNIRFFIIVAAVIVLIIIIFIIINITVLQTIASYQAVYGPIKPLAPKFTKICSQRLLASSKLQSKWKGRKFEDNEEV